MEMVSPSESLALTEPVTVYEPESSVTIPAKLSGFVPASRGVDGMMLLILAVGALFVPITLYDAS
jgi:hypothetical protein